MGKGLENSGRLQAVSRFWNQKITFGRFFWDTSVAFHTFNNVKGEGIWVSSGRSNESLTA